MDSAAIIRVEAERVTKRFRVGFKRHDSALAQALSYVSGRGSFKEQAVLSEVSLRAAAGENIGLIGQNGSGKSTLLRLIAGIYQADGGTVRILGEAIYLSGFDMILKPRLTMRENIHLIGLLLGLRPPEIKRRFAEIVAFSGLEEFLDTKTFQFSSGMLSRLGFSATIHCLEQKNPDIILLDEVFGGSGDLAFQDKALAKIENLLRGGATVIMASHDLGFVEKYCDRVLLLQQGRVAASGAPTAVLQRYHELIAGIPPAA